MVKILHYQQVPLDDPSFLPLHLKNSFKTIYFKKIIKILTTHRMMADLITKKHECNYARVSSDLQSTSWHKTNK